MYEGHSKMICTLFFSTLFLAALSALSVHGRFFLSHRCVDVLHQLICNSGVSKDGFPTCDLQKRRAVCNNSEGLRVYLMPKYSCAQKVCNPIYKDSGHY